MPKAKTEKRAEAGNGSEPPIYRLMAASRDLYAALRLVARGLNNGHIPDQTIIKGETVTPLSEIVNAALAKARGEQ